jgi:hypothetical protein
MTWSPRWIVRAALDAGHTAGPWLLCQATTARRTLASPERDEPVGRTLARIRVGEAIVVRLTGGQHDGHKESGHMATYRMVYGDSERTVQETFTDIDEVEREDGWVVLFRGKEAILRVQEAHVQSLEQLDG